MTNEELEQELAHADPLQAMLARYYLIVKLEEEEQNAAKRT